MKSKLEEVAISILDLANIIEGDASAGDAFQRSKALAQLAERLGYKRYWFAEHHNMESVTSAATAVLIGFVAGVTSRIRVGSGGIMLPNHAPLVIAEQFGTLETLYPGRIDLGIGRAPGTDGVTAQALRRNLKGDINEFPNDVVELINYLGPRDPSADVRAIPGQGTEVPVWLLGSSVYSAQLAAALGLPFAFAAHFAPRYLNEALKLYQSNFKPSKFLRAPYVMACVNIIAAKTNAEAEYLATSFYQLALGLFRNNRRPLQPPVLSMDDIWTEYEQAAVQQMMEYSFIGNTDTIKKSLQQFIERTGVDEVMIASHIYDIQAKMNSFEMVAPLFHKT